MAKRKGSEYEPSPPGARVVASPPITPSSDAAITARPPPTPSSVTWNDTKRLIRDLIAEYESSDDAASVREILALNEELEDRQKYVLEEAARIKEGIQERIGAASEELRERSGEVAQQMDRVASLEGEAEELRRQLESLSLQTDQTRRRAEKYRAEVSEISGGKDDGPVDEELRRLAEARKIRYQISLYAKIVGIKWDYDRTDMLAGEVNVPSKATTRRFCIDPSEHSDFDIANELWDLMDGEEPRLTTLL